jgi:hypothetical protein
MAEIFEHPHALVAAVILCLPAAFPIARYFFDDVETFKKDLGVDSEFDRSLWLLGAERIDRGLYIKIIGFLAAYAAVVLAVYQFFSLFL